jgi:protein-tyrosine phosphatase
MKNKITITGEINKKGIHGFANIRMFEEFAKKHPNKNTFITIQIEDKKSRNSLLAVYHIQVLPEWQAELHNRGIIKNIRQIDDMIRKGFPLLKNRSLSDLDYAELIMFMDYVKHTSLEEMNIVVTEPRIL